MKATRSDLESSGQNGARDRRDVKFRSQSVTHKKSELEHRGEIDAVRDRKSAATDKELDQA